jgi:hypothetical protein
LTSVLLLKAILAGVEEILGRRRKKYLEREWLFKRMFGSAERNRRKQ